MSTISNVSIKTSHYIIGAVGLTAALSWKDTIKSITSIIFPAVDNFMANLINAIIITIILVVIINILPDTKKELPEKTQVAIEMEEKDNKIYQLEKMVKKSNNNNRFGRF